MFKETIIFNFRISADDVRSKLSSNSKNNKVVHKPIDLDQLNEDDSDDYELGKDLRDEKKRKA